jgi:hypothetical protein
MYRDKTRAPRTEGALCLGKRLEVVFQQRIMTRMFGRMCPDTSDSMRNSCTYSRLFVLENRYILLYIALLHIHMNSTRPLASSLTSSLCLSLLLAAIGFLFELCPSAFERQPQPLAMALQSGRETQTSMLEKGDKLRPQAI